MVPCNNREEKQVSIRDQDGMVQTSEKQTAFYSTRLLKFLSRPGAWYSTSDPKNKSASS